MNMILIFPVFLFLALFGLTEILLGIWTYRDAKARGLNAVLWTLVVLLAPSFIGLIVYLAAGRNQAAGLCPTCAKAIQANVSFCPHCGGAVGGEAPPMKPFPPAGKGILIAFLVCVALFVVGALTLGILGVTRFNPNFIPDSNVSFGSIERTLERSWHMSFAALDGRKSNRHLRYDGAQPAAVRVRSSLGGGSMTLELTQGDIRSALDLSSANTESTIDLSVFEAGTITMTLIAEDARDGEVDISWD